MALYLLLKALLAQAPDCKLLSVGDDWQSQRAKRAAACLGVH